jgi:Glycosyltransferase
VVIGGWLPDLLKNDQKLKKKVAKLDGIYAETQLMADQLGRMGLSNVRLFTNFKRLPVVDPEEFVYPAKEPYQLCTFSTVIYEKGIEDAIEAVKAVNEADGEIRYTLDIYGPVAAVYGERFEQIRKTFPDYISYKEAVGSNESVGILKNYFALLFPTRNKTEGVPGTIIDAYAASLPVIASRWNSAEEVVIHNQTGFVYEFMNNKTLVEILRSILEDPQTVLKMKPNCIEMARKFAPEQTIINFTGYLES